MDEQSIGENNGVTEEIVLDRMPTGVLLRIFKFMLPKKPADEYLTRKDFGIIRCHVAPVCKRFYALSDHLSMFHHISYDGIFKESEFKAFCRFATAPVSSVTNEVPRIAATKKLGLKITETIESVEEFTKVFTLTNPIVYDLFAAAQQLWHLEILLCHEVCQSVDLLNDVMHEPPYHPFVSSVNASDSNVFPALTSLHIRAIDGVRRIWLGDLVMISLKGFKNLEKLSWLSNLDAIDSGWFKEHAEAGGKLEELSVSLTNSAFNLISACGRYDNALADAIRDHCPHLESLVIDPSVAMRAYLSLFLTRLVNAGPISSVKFLEIVFNDFNHGMYQKQLIAAIGSFPRLECFKATGYKDTRLFQNMKQSHPNIQVIQNPGFPLPRLVNEPPLFQVLRAIYDH